MAKINQKISTLPDVKDRRDADFIQSADTFLDILPNFSSELDTFGAEANNLRDEVNDLQEATKSYRDEAYKKAEEAKAVVIPEEATYSEEEIELRALTIGEAQFKALQEQRKKEYAGSGFVEWGNNPVHIPLINQSMYVHYDDWKSMYMTYGGLTELNINGDLIRLVSINYAGASNKIGLPNPTTSLFTITNSTSLNGDMKQGDFAILKDLDRELVTNGTFDDNIDGWVFNQCDGSYDDDNNRMKVECTDEYSVILQNDDNRKHLIKDIKYLIKVKVDTDENPDDMVFLEYSSGPATYHHFNFDSNGNGVLEFIPKSTFNAYKFFIPHKKDKVYYLDNISIKQVEEQPIVSLQDTTEGIDVYENSSLFEARDSVSRQDLVFLESFEVDVTTRLAYPFGNTQYRGGNVDRLSGIGEGDFEGADTYSLFGNWQQPGDLVGKGYKWDDLSIEDKIKFVSNPEHNVYLSKDGKFIQVQYRIRVVKGLGNEWSNIDPQIIHGRLTYDSSANNRVQVKGWLNNISNDTGKYNEFTSLGEFYNEPSYYEIENGIFKNNASDLDDENKVFALPIALVQRVNDGIFHKIYNLQGTAYLINDNGDDLVPFEEFALDNTYITSLEDCFNISKIAYKDSDGNYVKGDDDSAVTRTGTIASAITANESGRYSDEINEMDVEDLRMSAHKKVLKEIHDVERMTDINGKRRGKETSTYFNGNIDLTDKTEWKHYPNDIEDITYLSEKTHQFNNTLIQTDIIGDPRKLSDRIEYTVTDTDETISIHKNEYIKCDDDTNNGGTTGHLYRLLAGDISNIHSNSTDGDANTEDGHIDFSDTDVWLDLGDDLTTGGYKDEWLEKGFNGTPLIVGENGESLLPIAVGIYDDTALKIKVIKKYVNYYKLYVSDKNGNFINYSKGDLHNQNKYNVNNTLNVYYININNSYSDLGYDSEQEMLDLMKVVVIYETQTNTMELANNSKVLDVYPMAEKGYSSDINEGVFVTSNLINKIPTNGIMSINTESQTLTFTKVSDNTLDGGGVMIPKNNSFDFSNSSHMPQIKQFTYLTQENNRLYLQYVFKELKYDDDTHTWGDDNKFQIVSNVSTTTDDNGNTVLYGQKRIPLPYFYNEED